MMMMMILTIMMMMMMMMIPIIVTMKWPYALNAYAYLQPFTKQGNVLDAQKLFSTKH